MLFSIHCLDQPDRLPIRSQYYEAHRAHLDKAAITLVLAGPITAEDGMTPIGSVFIVDAPNRAAAEAFNQADPFYRFDVWDKSAIHIHPFLKRRGWITGF